ncbi:MAG: hypothetical protein F6J98_01260, partial [Moorea sp. SIO4G2]|nr:hypothetical protein [Moorena sp. SIO4G2]
GQRSAVSGQRSAVSGQRSAVSGQLILFKSTSTSVAQALALAKRPRYANGHAVRTTL